MNVKEYPTEIEKSQQLSKFAISLIREHFDPSSETSFLELSREVANYFREIGKDQIATFIDCQNGDCTKTFVPM